MSETTLAASHAYHVANKVVSDMGYSCARNKKEELIPPITPSIASTFE